MRFSFLFWFDKRLANYRLTKNPLKPQPMKNKDIFVDTFLDEIREFKGPMRKVPENYFSQKLIEEVEIDTMSEFEKKFFSVIYNKVKSKRHLQAEVDCLNTILLNLIQQRMISEKYEKIRKYIYSNDHFLIFKPKYKIVIGKLDKIDPLIVQSLKYSTFSPPLYLIGTTVFN